MIFFFARALPLVLALTPPAGFTPKADGTAIASQPQPTEDARRAFVAGRAAFAHGEYQKAAEFFALAHRIFPHPNTRYNLALALEANGQAREAWVHYTEVSREASNPADREDATIRADHLLDRLALVRFYATTTQQVCLSGRAPASYGTPGWFLTVVEPGEHQLVMGERRRNVLLRAGTVYEFQLTDQQTDEQPRTRRRARGLAIAAAGVASLALGFQVAGLATGSSSASTRAALQGVGLTLSAGALGLGIGAWRLRDRPLHRRAQSQSDFAVVLVCPQEASNASAQAVTRDTFGQ